MQSLAWVAVVEFKEVGQRLAFLEGDDGQKDVAGEREIERGVGFAMAVTVFLPSAGVAFVVVAVFPPTSAREPRPQSGIFLPHGGWRGKRVCGFSALGVGPFSPTNRAGL